jgi:Tfp pilus assembly protein PilV
MFADGRRRGSALIEAVVAMVMLAVAGTGLITLLGQTRHAMRTLRESEMVEQSAAAQLDRLVLLDRPSLAALEGRTMANGWSLRVETVFPGVFDVSVARTDTSAPLLATTLYRPDSAHATP